MTTGLADLTLEQLADITLPRYSELPLESTGGQVGECLWNQELIHLILSSLATLAGEMVNIKNDLATIKTTTSALAKPGDAMALTGPTVTQIQSGLATATGVTGAKNEIIAHGDQQWKGGSGGGGSGNAPTAAENAAAVWNYAEGNGRLLSSPIPTVGQIQEGLANTEELQAARDTVIAHGNKFWTKDV